jgi:hypothetical protein
MNGFQMGNFVAYAQKFDFNNYEMTFDVLGAHRARFL